MSEFFPGSIKPLPAHQAVNTGPVPEVLAEPFEPSKLVRLNRVQEISQALRVLLLEILVLILVQQAIKGSERVDEAFLAGPADVHRATLLRGPHHVYALESVDAVQVGLPDRQAVIYFGKKLLPVLRPLKRWHALLIL